MAIPVPVPAPNRDYGGIVSTGVQPAGNTGFFGGLQNIFTTIGDVAKQGFEAYSGYQDAQTALELQKIRNQAIVTTSKQAPLIAQASLPSTSQLVQDPQAATRQILPSVITGGLQGTGTSFAMVAGAVLLGVLALKAVK